MTHWIMPSFSWINNFNLKKIDNHYILQTEKLIVNVAFMAIISGISKYLFAMIKNALIRI